LKKVKSLCPKDVPCQISMHSGQRFMRRRFFKDLSKFSLFCPLLGPKRGQPLYLNKSESPSPKHACFPPSLVEIGQVVHEKKMFEDLTKFSLFCPLLGLKRGQPLFMHKSESPSLKHVSHQVWLKLAMWFVRRCLSFCYICLYKNVPLGFGHL